TSDARSFWSPEVDGNDVTKGGAASRLPSPDKRKLYTHLSGESDLTHSSNALDPGNPAITDAVMGTGDSTSTCGPECEIAIRWAYGYDVHDLDEDGSTSDQIRFMGDPLHGRPAVVVYGGTTAQPDDKDAVVFVPTNDGFLHAINAHSGSDGQ